MHYDNRHRNHAAKQTKYEENRREGGTKLSKGKTRRKTEEERTKAYMIDEDEGEEHCDLRSIIPCPYRNSVKGSGNSQDCMWWSTTPEEMEVHIETFHGTSKLRDRFRQQKTIQPNRKEKGEESIKGNTEGRGLGEENTSPNWDFSSNESKLDDIIKPSMMKSPHRLAVIKCPYANSEGCPWIWVEDSQEEAYVKKHLESHLFQGADSIYIKHIRDKGKNNNDTLSLADTIQLSGESNAYVWKRLARMVANNTQGQASPQLERLENEIRILNDNQQRVYEKLKLSEEIKPAHQENVEEVPDLTKNKIEHVDLKELKRIPDFNPDNYEAKQRPMALLRFLKKLYTQIEQKGYTDRAAVSILLDKLQVGTAPNPALDIVEVTQTLHKQKHGSLPSLKQITRKLEQKYCPDYTPENALKKLEAISSEERENMDQLLFKITYLTRLASRLQEEDVRESWYEKKSLQTFLANIRRADREIILNQNLQRESIGHKPLDLCEAVNLIEKVKLQREAYKDDNNNRPRNQVIRQVKVEEKGKDEENGPRERLRQSPRYQGPRNNGLQVDIYNRRMMIDRRNGIRPDPNATPPRRVNYNYTGFKDGPITNTRQKAILVDRNGSRPAPLNPERANVNVGECFKCGGKHIMSSMNCPMKLNYMAQVPCEKCKRGLHEAKDCLTQFSPLEKKENEAERSRRVKEELREDYYDRLCMETIL